MVWHRDLPDHRHWNWVYRARHAVLTITRAQPPEPWTELRTEALALFKYPARCLTHKCPAHGPPRPRCTAIAAAPRLEDTLAGALRGPCHVVPPPGPGNRANVPAAPNRAGGMIP